MIKLLTGRHKLLKLFNGMYMFVLFIMVTVTSGSCFGHIFHRSPNILECPDVLNSGSLYCNQLSIMIKLLKDATNQYHCSV